MAGGDKYNKRAQSMATGNENRLGNSLYNQGDMSANKK
jgi:hypothetical protein